MHNIVSKLFDPLGIIEPFSVKGKILLQELWKMKLGWDDAIPLQSVEDWRKWIKDIPLIDQFTIKRRYF